MEPVASVAGNVMPRPGGGEHSLKIGRDLRHLRQNERGQQRETEAGDGHEQTRAEPCNGREMGVQAQRIHERGKNTAMYVTAAIRMPLRKSCFSTALRVVPMGSLQ